MKEDKKVNVFSFVEFYEDNAEVPISKSQWKIIEAQKRIIFEILWNDLFLIWNILPESIERADCQRDPISNHLEHESAQASKSSEQAVKQITNSKEKFLLLP